MITFQENTHFSQALPCTRKEFWEQVKRPTTRWRIDMRRAQGGMGEKDRCREAFGFCPRGQRQSASVYLLL